MTQFTGGVEFIGVLRRRLALAVLAALMGAAAIVLGVLLSGRVTGHFPMFVAGFYSGTGAAVAGIGIFAIVQTLAALRNPVKRKKEETDYYDERNRFIRDKGNAVTGTVMLYLLYAAVIVSGWFDSVVFFTLLGVLLVMSLVMAGAKIIIKARH